MSDLDRSAHFIRRFHMTKEGPVVEITDMVVPFRSAFGKTVPGKAALANDISIYLQNFIRSRGIVTHFHERAGLTEQAVFETVRPPFELLLSNVATDELIAEFALDAGTRFVDPLIEVFLRRGSEVLRVSETHLSAFNIVDRQTMALLLQLALRTNDLLTGILFGIGVELESMRLEFGVHFEPEQGEPVYMVTSELSPDTMMLRDMSSGLALDSRRAFDSDGNELSGYQEIVRRFDLDSARSLLSR